MTLNSFSKTNRGSVWIKTLTLAGIDGMKQILHSTYPIAIGKKGNSHEEVERKFNEELEKLKSHQLQPFYIGGLKKTVPIHFECFRLLQDQPERRSHNYLMLGNNTYTARWRVSALVGKSGQNSDSGPELLLFQTFLPEWVLRAGITVTGSLFQICLLYTSDAADD